MNFAELLLLGVGLSMDAFAVSVCKGLATRRPSLKNMAACGLWFGGFQALMPLIGFYLGILFAEAIEAVDHWVALILLVVIGLNMIREAVSGEEEHADADFSVRTMLTMAIATSIDALAVGISLAMSGGVQIWSAIAIIGVTTCLLSMLGVKLGSVFGDRFGKKAQIAGGVILILLGLKILLEHLGVL